MNEFIGHVAWPLAFAYFAHRLCSVLAQFTPAGRSATSKTDEEEVDVPQDLLALVATERESWAQEEVLRVITERYEDLRDWNLVRRAMGIGEVDS